jgi:hypothetical protein
MNVPDGMKHFFTGPVIKTELLIVWLEKHGIEARQEWAVTSERGDSGQLAEANPATESDVEDLDREAHVFVVSSGYERAYQLFYVDNGDEL